VAMAAAADVLTYEELAWGFGSAAVALVGLNIAFAFLLIRYQRKCAELSRARSGRPVYHSESMCAAPCPLHSPSDHHMTGWALIYRPFKGIFERECPHGCGHPDPDSVDFVRRVRGEDGARVAAVHGCDGCCWDACGDQAPPEDRETVPD
jgi:hypothetical protein